MWFLLCLHTDSYLWIPICILLMNIDIQLHMAPLVDHLPRFWFLISYWSMVQPIGVKEMKTFLDIWRCTLNLGQLENQDFCNRLSYLNPRFFYYELYKIHAYLKHWRTGGAVSLILVLLSWGSDSALRRQKKVTCCNPFEFSGIMWIRSLPRSCLNTRWRCRTNIITTAYAYGTNSNANPKIHSFENWPTNIHMFASAAGKSEFSIGAF